MQVQIDFGTGFPTVDGLALRLAWPNIRRNVVSVLGNKKIDEKFKAYKKNGDVKTLVKLLKVLPTQRKSFQTSLHSLLKLSEVIRFYKFLQTEPIAKHFLSIQEHEC